uniref:Uncharacterized protein n=1 Tax=Solanum lycopersicum TaxID=4081 RepID=A0A3Q7GSZ0_SOLLC
MRSDGEFRTQNQLDSCALTREQYDQVLQFLGKNLEVSQCVNATDKEEVLLAATHIEHEDRVTENIDTQLLHQRLGHVSSSVLKS